MARKKSKTTTLELTEEQAAANAAEAQAHFKELEQRLKSGEAVPREELLAAREDATYTALLVDGARAAEKRREAEAIRVELKALAATAAEKVPPAAREVVSAYDAAVSAVVALGEKVDGFNATFRPLHNRARKLNAPPTPENGSISQSERSIGWHGGTASKLDHARFVKAILHALDEGREYPILDIRGLAPSDTQYDADVVARFRSLTEAMTTEDQA